MTALFEGNHIILINQYNVRNLEIERKDLLRNRGNSYPNFKRI